MRHSRTWQIADPTERACASPPFDFSALPARPGRIAFLLDPLSVLVEAVLVQDYFLRPALVVSYKSDLGVDNL